MQARLKEAESQCALKEMQDKILDMEKVCCLRLTALPDYHSMRVSNHINIQYIYTLYMLVFALLGTHTLT